MVDRAAVIEESLSLLMIANERLAESLNTASSTLSAAEKSLLEHYNVQCYLGIAATDIATNCLSYDDTSA